MSPISKLRTKLRLINSGFGDYVVRIGSWFIRVPMYELRLSELFEVLSNTKVRSSLLPPSHALLLLPSFPHFDRRNVLIRLRAGQKCSALSRLYVPRSMWEAKGGFKEILLEEIAKITVGPPGEFSHFMGPVMCVSSSFLLPSIFFTFGCGKIADMVW